jgi:hypothetical protein
VSGAHEKTLLTISLQKNLWALTCNACVEALSMGIDPLSIRNEKYLCSENSAKPTVAAEYNHEYRK